MCEPDPRTIAGLAELVPNFSLLVEDLAHLSNDDIKSMALAVFPRLTLWALRDARDATALLDNLVHWAAALREVARAPNGVAALAQLLRYVALVSDDLQLDAFRAKIREQAPEAERAAMTTIAEQLLRQGREEGEVRGREQGRVEGRVELLTKLLALEFGSLSTEHEQRIALAAAEQLDRYVERVLRAESIDDVLAE